LIECSKLIVRLIAPVVASAASDRAADGTWKRAHGAAWSGAAAAAALLTTTCAASAQHGMRRASAAGFLDTLMVTLSANGYCPPTCVDTAPTKASVSKASLQIVR